jgi:multiple antibiotic resistance protein
MEGLFEAIITLFVIMDPIGNIPAFISLTKGMPLKEIRKSLNDAMLVAAVLLFAFLFLGLKIFDFFSIDINSFQIAGGIILFIIGLLYVFGISGKIAKAHGNDLSIPIGTPLLTGPGTITTIIIIVKENGIMTAVIAAVIVLAAAWLILANSARLYGFLGEHWTNIISRVMGILLAAIAVKFVTNGVLSIASGCE